MDIARLQASPVGQVVPLRGTDGRNGEAYDHFAFAPNPLGVEPNLSGEAWRAVSRAGHALGRLQQASRQIPVPSLLRRPTLRREAQSTSALEGTFAPLEDVLAADVTEKKARSAELIEVLNYIDCAEAAFGWLAEGRQLSVPMLRELHRALVHGSAADTDDAGRIRHIQVAIGSPTANIEDARFIPMAPGQALEAATQNTIDWVNLRVPVDRDPVVAAAMAHYQFEALHPFNDGNGRLGRLLVVVQLIQDGALSDPLLSVSPWLEARRTQYQDRLFAVSADGDWDGWVKFFASGLEASAIDTAQRVDELLDVQADYARRLRDAGATGIVRDIADSLVGYPFVTISAVKERTGKTFQGVSTAVNRLVDLQILRERTGRSHNRVFEAVDVMRVLVRPARTAKR